MERLLRDGNASPDDLAKLLNDPAIPGVNAALSTPLLRSDGPLWSDGTFSDGTTVPVIGGHGARVANSIREALERPAESIAEALSRPEEPFSQEPYTLQPFAWGGGNPPPRPDDNSTYTAQLHALAATAWDALMNNWGGQPAPRPYLTQPELSAAERRYEALLKDIADLWGKELYEIAAWERYWRAFQTAYLVRPDVAEAELDSWPYAVDDAEEPDCSPIRRPMFFGLINLEARMARKDFVDVADRYEAERAKLIADPIAADESAFWRAVAAAPDDNLPRLVYADWLDERGDLFGGWIRASIAPAPDNDPTYHTAALGDRMGDKVVRLLGLEMRGDHSHCPLEREAFRTTERLSWGWDRGFPVSVAMPARYLEHFLGQRGENDPGTLCPVLPAKQLVITSPFSPERDFGHWTVSKASKIEQVVVVGNGRSSRRSANHIRHHFRNAVVLYTLGSQAYLTEALLKTPGQTRLLIVGEYVGREWQRLQMVSPAELWRPAITFTHGLTAVNCPCGRQVQIGQHAWVNPGTPMFVVWGQCPSCLKVYMDGDPVPIMDNDQWAVLRPRWVNEEAMWGAGDYAGRIEPSVSGFPVGRPRTVGDVT